MSTILLLAGALYVALGAFTWSRARKTGNAALRRLAPFFLVLGTLTSLALLIGADVPAPLVMAPLAIGLGIYPTLLLRFASAIAPVSRSVRVGASALAAVAAVVVLVAATSSGPDGGITGVVAVFFLALPATMLAAHIVAGLAIRGQAARLSSSYIRRRALLLNTGLAGLAGAAVLGLTGIAERLGPLTSPELALLAGIVLVAASSPPVWLNAVLAQPDLDLIAQAEHDLAMSGGEDDAGDGFLQAIARLVGATAVWFERDGVVLAGADPSHVPGSQAVGTAGDSQRWDVQPLDDDRWLLCATGITGRLVAVTGAEAITYGLDQADLLARLARRFELALDRRLIDGERVEHVRAQAQAQHFRAMSELKDDLLSTINHELRTPLVTVTGLLDLLADRWEELDDRQRQHMVERMVSNAHVLQDTVLSVLDLAALRTGATTVALEERDVDALLTAVVCELDQDRRVTLQAATGSSRIDPLLTDRVVRHLTSNALLHTAGPVTVRADLDDGMLTVSVADSGDGLPAELLEPFARGGHYLTRATRGLGLGLALVRETMTLLRGTLDVQSSAAGTTITCRFPTPHVIDLDGRTPTRRARATAGPPSLP